MKLISLWAALVMICGIGAASAAPVTGNSFHFQAVIGATKLCNSTTSASYAQLASGSAANAPDVLIKNIGTTVVYYEISSGGASATAATVPTNSTGGSQPINPGEADLMSKASADTISCINSSSTGTLSFTPGTGN
jgi:hypothetical protein